MKGDLVLLVIGRDPRIRKIEWLKTEAEGKRRIAEAKARAEEKGWEIRGSNAWHVIIETPKGPDVIAYYLLDPNTFQRRIKGYLTAAQLRPDLRP